MSKPSVLEAMLAKAQSKAAAAGSEAGSADVAASGAVECPLCLGAGTVSEEQAAGYVPAEAPAAPAAPLADASMLA